MTEQKPIRILHVEDNPRAIQLTQLCLERKNTDFKITAVLSAKQALEKLKTEKFDVVVSDYQMPEMNGIELLENLRLGDNKIPFIILTGEGKEKEAIEALNKGADRYIKKECNLAALFDTLDQYIQDVIADKKKEEEAYKALSILLEEEKKLKCLERDSKELLPQESIIDASTLLNGHLDLVILGILADLLADEDSVQTRMSKVELTEEIQRKFGIRVDLEALHTSVVKLEGKGILTTVGERVALLPNKLFPYLK